MKPILFLFLAFLLGAGCATTPPNLVSYSYPFSAKGRVILIQHFDFNPGVSTKVNQAAVQKFGELIALDIQRCLGNAKFDHPLVISPGEKAKGDFLIRGTITRVQGGDSRERMTFEVFGFGATEVRAVGEVVDLTSSRSVASFSLVKQTSYGWLDNESAVRENLREVAREIAAILIEAK
jgi:hypothetical protein